MNDTTTTVTPEVWHATWLSVLVGQIVTRIVDMAHAVDPSTGRPEYWGGQRQLTSTEHQAVEVADRLLRTVSAQPQLAPHAQCCETCDRRLDTDAVDWAEGDVLPNFTHQRVGDDEVFVFCPFCQVDYDGMALVVATLTDGDLMRRRSSYLHQQVDFDTTPRIERGLQVTTDEARRRGLYGYGDTTPHPTQEH